MGYGRGPSRSQNSKILRPNLQVLFLRREDELWGDPRTPSPRWLLERPPPAPALHIPASDLGRRAAEEARQAPARRRAMPFFILTRRRRPPLTWQAGMPRPAPHRRPRVWTGLGGHQPSLREAGGVARAPESSAPPPGTRRLVSKEPGSGKGGAGRREVCACSLTGVDQRREGTWPRAAHARWLGAEVKQSGWKPWSFVSGGGGSRRRGFPA